MILLGTGGSIQPMSEANMETSCVINEKKVMHPFAYRTHTHSLGERHLTDRMWEINYRLC